MEGAAETDTSKATEAAGTMEENLSTKISNLTVLNTSLQTVSNTYKGIRESSTYVEYSMTVAESSFDKALKAGKSVLDSSTLAPIKTRAMDNIQYLDKEAGAMVDKIFGSKTQSDNTENEVEGVETKSSIEVKCGVEEISDSTVTSCVVSKQESMLYYLSRKIFELKSAPVNTRKRKERSSICKELQELEPSPVKRRYGDRQSSSDGSLVEMLHIREDYVSEDDPDYIPPENKSEDSDALSESDQEEIKKEAEDLRQDLKDSYGVILDGRGTEDSVKEKKDKKQRDRKSPQVVSLELKDIEPKAEKDNKQGNKPGSKIESNKKDSTKNQHGSEKDNASNKNDRGVTLQAESTNENEPVGKNIDSTSKSRKSSKSPLLEKLLSPSRRKSEKKAKAEKAASENASQSKKDKSENPEKSKEVEGQDTSLNQPLSGVAGPFDVFKSGGKKSK